MYRVFIRPLLFLFPPRVSHAIAMALLAPLEYVTFLRSWVRALCLRVDPRLEVKRLGLTFPSPIGLAAGLDKNGKRARALAALGFGYLELGTLTRRRQAANAAPNLFRLPEDQALINRLGFPNEGAEKIASRLRRRFRSARPGIPIGISIGKSRTVPLDPIQGVIDDYLGSFECVRDIADFVVINISSPNTKDLRSIQGADLARILFSALVEANNKGRRVPLLVKIAPDLSEPELDELLVVVKEARFDGVVATNTTISRAGLRADPLRVKELGAGGLSGPPLRDRAIDIVRRARRNLGGDVTIIGVGGIETTEDVLAFLRAGADLVQVYTGFIYGGPLLITNLTRDLACALSKKSAPSLSALTD